MIRTLVFLLCLCCLATPLAAQDGTTPEEVERTFDKLRAELDNLRLRVEEAEKSRLDEELRSANLVNLYGDIGVRYNMLFESERETYNRPEFRLHLGVYGTAFDVDRQRIRYEMRFTTFSTDAKNRPSPTLSWIPFPGFGAVPLLGVDRFMFEYTLDRTFTTRVGRFPLPYVGSELVFDQDVNFQGLSQVVRFDYLFGDSFRRVVPRFELALTQSYLGQNNIGLPVPSAESQPIYLGGQLIFNVAPFESAPKEGEPPITSEFEWRLAIGIHWFDGEEAIADNLGVGNLEVTTNVLAPDGRVKSEFTIAEVYTEFVFLRSRRARLTAWAHGAYNLSARPAIDGTAEKNERAFVAGIKWGMERMEQRWDFNFGVEYFYVEADAVVPEFNHEDLNTNTKGYRIHLQVMVFPRLVLFTSFGMQIREDYEKAGFGAPNENDPNRSSGQSMRINVGIWLEF